MSITERIIHEIDNHPLNRGLRGIDWVADPRNIALVTPDEQDIALFDYVEPGTYEGHYLFRSKGKEAVERTRYLARYMFTVHGAKVLIGQVPVKYRQAGVIARSAGWKYAGIKDTEDGQVFVYLLSAEMH